MMYSERQYLRSLGGKSVALVGPAASLAGQGRGKEIDRHDIVVRMNMAYERSPDLAPDYGSRTDVLYTILMAPGNRMLNGADVAAMHADDVKWVVSKWGEDSKNARRYERFLKHAASLKTTSIPNDFVDGVRAEVEGEPHTGPLAIAHLLTSRLKRLDVYGCDFYQTGYYGGYAGLTAAEQAKITDHAAKSDKGEWTWVSKRTIKQNTDRLAQQRMIVRLLDSDRRLHMDPALVASMRGAVAA